MRFLVVSVRFRGKQIANYGRCSCIYTVDSKIKGDRGKMLGKTIEVGMYLEIMYWVHCTCLHSSQNSNSLDIEQAGNMLEIAEMMRLTMRESYINSQLASTSGLQQLVLGESSMV